MVNLLGGRHPRTDREKKVAVELAEGLCPSRGSGTFRHTRRAIVAQCSRRSGCPRCQSKAADARKIPLWFLPIPERKVFAGAVFSCH